MKRFSKTLALFFGSVALSGTLSAGILSVTWYTDATGNIQFYAPDHTTLLSSGYSVALGVFAGTPDFSGPTASLPAFNSLGSTAWSPNFAGMGFGAAQLNLDFNSSVGFPPGAGQGQQVYAWVYNSTVPVPTSQWLFITNPSWTLPAIPSGAGVSGIEWTITDPGTTYALGALNGNQVTLGTVIPEPATYAVILGLATLGFAGFRRFRMRA